MKNMKITYNNLGQITKGRLVYFRSTDIEQKNYHRLLWSVPDEWLYLLTKGDQITINDISSNKKGKVERIFIPVLNDLLNFIWLAEKPKNNNLQHHLEFAIQALDDDSMLHRKFMFWTKLCKEKVEIVAKTKIVDKEPNPLSEKKGKGV
jgi:hypothetical protein